MDYTVLASGAHLKDKRGPGRPKGSGLGVYSCNRSLIELDKRSREWRLMRGVRHDLTTHIGGKPNAAQRMLIATPVPYAEIPREVAVARVGGWSRHLDSKQAAKRALRIKSEAPASVAGERNAPPTYGDSSQEIASALPKAEIPLKSLGDRPQNPSRGGRPRKVRIVRPEAYRRYADLVHGLPW